MKINPDDPASKMTIRLRLAVEMMKSLHIVQIANDLHLCVVNAAFDMADTMIERANRDEGT